MMTTHTDGHTTSFECDSCDAVYEASSKRWSEAWEQGAKAEGWAAVKDGERWQHFCPGCREQYGRDNRPMGFPRQ